MKEFWFRLCITPVYVVDIFFIISGFLIAFLTVAEIKKKRGKMNWPMFIVHRLIRICPIYFFMLMIFVALMKYFGESPLWPMFWEKYEDPCSYWWANTLFISNFVPTDEYSCMGWTWYISTDMQFYIITPVLILVYMKNRKIGYGLIAVLSVASIAAMFGQAYHNEYNPGMVHGIMKKDQFLNFYQKPYNRIGAYLVGIGLGFVFREFCDLQEKKPKGNNEVELVGRDSDVGLISNERRKGTEKLFWVVLWTQNRIFRIVGFLLGLSLMIMVIFIPHEFENHGEDYWSRGAKSFYLSIEHLLFSVGFALVLIPLIQGHGGLVKQFLSSKYFAVGAKISFSFYLIHPMVILFNGFNRPDSHYVSHFNYWYSLPSTIIFTTILSTLVTLILESPITNLEKIIFRR
jgi:peptidoglycan/LPS O-acetylase OafA/YrhL